MAKVNHSGDYDFIRQGLDNLAVNNTQAKQTQGQTQTPAQPEFAGSKTGGAAQVRNYLDAMSGKIQTPTPRTVADVAKGAVDLWNTRYDQAKAGSGLTGWYNFIKNRLQKNRMTISG